MKATEQYFPVVLFIMLYKVALTFESVAETSVGYVLIFHIDQHFSVVLLVNLPTQDHD